MNTNQCKLQASWLSTILLAAGLIVALPLAPARADDDWEDRWEDYYDDLEDRREDARERWEDWHDDHDDWDDRHGRRYYYGPSYDYRSRHYPDRYYYGYRTAPGYRTYYWEPRRYRDYPRYRYYGTPDVGYSEFGRHRTVRFGPYRVHWDR